MISFDQWLFLGTFVVDGAILLALIYEIKLFRKEIEILLREKP